MYLLFFTEIQRTVILWITGGGGVSITIIEVDRNCVKSQTLRTYTEILWTLIFSNKNVRFFFYFSGKLYTDNEWSESNLFQLIRVLLRLMCSSNVRIRINNHLKKTQILFENSGPILENKSLKGPWNAGTSCFQIFYYQYKIGLKSKKKKQSDIFIRIYNYS